MSWNEEIPKSEITTKVTEETAAFAKRFGTYLASDKNAMTSSQLRKFFGEIKRQQMYGFNRTDFVLLKPKLAYAAARSNNNNKIRDFYKEIIKVIDLVEKPEQFENFIKMLEAIVAYHRAKEEKIDF